MRRYCFASGLLSVLLAAGHTWWGWTHALPEIRKLDARTQASCEISWHQIGMTLAVGGITLLIHAMRGGLSRAVPGVLLAIYSTNFIVYALFISVKYRSLFAATIPQCIIFVAMLITLGLTVRSKKVSR